MERVLTGVREETWSISVILLFRVLLCCWCSCKDTATQAAKPTGFFLFFLNFKGTGGLKDGNSFSA